MRLVQALPRWARRAVGLGVFAGAVAAARALALASNDRAQLQTGDRSLPSGPPSRGRTPPS